MAKLYGRDWTREELLQRCGRLEQLAGCTRSALTEGMEKDVEICDFRTGSGFRFVVSPTRGMDIVFAEYQGIPLCWNSSTGVTHPAYFSEKNWGWMRGFYGGWVTTCGLSSFSASSEDAGEFYGLHDRISYTPAAQVRTDTSWLRENDRDECEFSCTGTMRETRVFGPNLTLTRRVATRLGQDNFTIHDIIRNEGYTTEPAMILYHCNFGFPLVGPRARVHLPTTHIEGTKAFAASMIDTWDQLEEPQADMAERCYYHRPQAGADGMVQAAISNPDLPFWAYVRYPLAEMPYFTQWKMMGAGNYVCGLEPSNAPLRPRAILRERGELTLLEPGQEWHFHLELGVAQGTPAASESA